MTIMHYFLSLLGNVRNLPSAAFRAAGWCNLPLRPTAWKIGAFLRVFGLSVGRRVNSSGYGVSVTKNINTFGGMIYTARSIHTCTRQVVGYAL